MTGCTFNLYRDTESGVGAIFSPLEEGVGETAFTDDSAENGETYYYVVTSVSANGEESSSSNTNCERSTYISTPIGCVPIIV